jgi:aldose 1-epimerase
LILSDQIFNTEAVAMMNSRITPYAELADGTLIRRICLDAHGLSMTVLTWGAVIQDLKISTGAIKKKRVVLGLNCLDDYINHSPYFGAIAGRCANRTSSGRFELDGKIYQLTQNEPSGHHLHGGIAGLSKRPWSLIEASHSHVTLAILSSDGEEGYPGALRVRCTYRILSPAQLSVELTAQTTAPTLVNLAQHTYFNLDQSKDVRSHCLWIDADTYLPTDENYIPSGDIVSVDNTSYEFRKLRQIGNFNDCLVPPYDNNYVLSHQRRSSPVPVATLVGTNNLAMDMITDQPGLQFYDGARIDVPVTGLSGLTYGAYAGLCLEPQIWPDSQNHSHFPSAILRPGTIYNHNSAYRFYERTQSIDG